MMVPNVKRLSEQPVKPQIIESRRLCHLQMAGEILLIDSGIFSPPGIKQERDFRASAFPVNMYKPSVSDQSLLMKKAEQYLMRVRIREPGPDLLMEVTSLLLVREGAFLAQDVHLLIPPFFDQEQIRVSDRYQAVLPASEFLVFQADVTHLTPSLQFVELSTKCLSLRTFFFVEGYSSVFRRCETA